MGPGETKAARFTAAEQRFDPEAPFVRQVGLLGRRQVRNQAQRFGFTLTSVDGQGQTRQAMFLGEADLFPVAHLTGTQSAAIHQFGDGLPSRIVSRAHQTSLAPVTHEVPVLLADPSDHLFIAVFGVAQHDDVPVGAEVRLQALKQKPSGRRR